jgi:hypothetical protein
MCSSYLKAILLSFLAISCGKDTSLELQRADLVFKRATEALARGDHHVSRQLLSELLALETSLGRKARQAEAALLLADNYIAGADFDSADNLCARAQRLYNDVADRNGLRASVVAQARALHIRGNNDEAYALLTDELRVSQALGLSDGTRELKWLLVPVARAMGHAEAEQRLLQELFHDASNAGDLRALAKVLDEYGKMFLHRGQLDSAKQRFLAAFRLAEGTGDSLLAIESSMHCAVAADKMKNSAEAFRYFTLGLRRTDITKGAEQLREEMLLRVANMYLRQGRFAGARRFLLAALRSAITTQNKLVEGYSLLQLGHCAPEPKSAEAAHSYNAGAALLSLIGLPQANAYAQMCLGEFALRNPPQADFDDALQHFRSSVASEDSAFAKRDDLDLFADCENVLRSPHDALIGLLIQLGKYAEGYAEVENRNRRAIFRALSGSHISVGDVQLNSALEKFHRARSNYVGAERQLADAFTHRSESQTLAQNIQRSLMRHSERLRDIGDSIATYNKRLRGALAPQPATPEEIQRALPENSALVQFVPTEHALYSFILTRQTLSVRLAAVERKLLEAMMSQYLEALKARSVDIAPAKGGLLERHIADLSAQLYGLFVRPIESTVAAVKAIASATLAQPCATILLGENSVSRYKPRPIPTPISAAKNEKLGKISRSASCGGENGKARTITSVAHWQTKSTPARSLRQRRSVATIPTQPIKSGRGETVIAVQTKVLYQGSG